MPDPTPCADAIFRDGTPILAADTGPVGGNHIFEAWVRVVAKTSGQPVDWHYSGGRAQVLALGDLDAVRSAARNINVPDGITILRWFGEGEGLYRSRTVSP
jgi:hypothetical protein